jgi:hypothetical protein
LHTQQFFELYLKPTKVEQGGAGNRVDENVEIARFGVATV